LIIVICFAINNKGMKSEKIKEEEEEEEIKP
jgi:hypothetical protein